MNMFENWTCTIKGSIFPHSKAIGEFNQEGVFYVYLAVVYTIRSHE